MRKYKMNNLNACLCAAVCLSLFSSCKDDDIYDDEAPAWLGENIYEYLEHEGQYTSYLALVKDLGYEETLRRTGSKTLFPATDEAFANYFRANGMNGSGAEFVHGLPASQKRYLFNTTMLNMAYLSNMLANVTSDADGLSEGTAVRRTSSATLLDTVPCVSYADMPKTSVWKRFERKGGTFLADNGNRMSVFFTPQYFSRINVTESDWNVISKGWGTPWDASGFYVNGIHVQAQNKDVTCKNGYLHLADGVVTPLKIDISTGDAITPREVRYSFKLMLEDRSIDIWAYNLETVLAEKLETIITRTTTNTRMRDFYDIYILDQLHGNTLNRQTLHDALRATAHKRGTEQHLAEAAEVFEEVENSPVMQKLWESYRKKFSYAADLEWNIIMGAVRSLYALSEKESSL